MHVNHDRGSCYTIEQNKYVIEQSHSKGLITVRRFDLEGICQSQNRRQFCIMISVRNVMLT